MIALKNKPLNFGRAPRQDLSVHHEPDPTCPDCKGKCTDKHGFDCVRCAGEGVVDE